MIGDFLVLHYTGSGYESSSIAFIGNDGTSFGADTVTVDSGVQMTTLEYSKIKFMEMDIDVKVTAPVSKVLLQQAQTIFND